MAGNSQQDNDPELAPEVEAGAADSSAETETGKVSVAQDILLRSFGKIVRRRIESGLLNRTRESDETKLLIESRSLVQAVATYGVARVATKSVPGAILVGSGLVMKMLFDRSQARRDAKRQGIANRHKSEERSGKE